MKIKTARDTQERARGRRRRWLLIFAAIGLYSVLLAVAVMSLRPHSGEFGSWLRAPRRYVRAVLAAEPVETLAIDLKFKHLHRLHKKRDQALTDGMLVASPGDFVPASIGAAPADTAVELRLMGEAPEHFAGNTWTLEVRVADDGHVLGLRRFALYPIAAVDSQARVLHAGHLADEHLPSPRTQLLQLTLNGDDLGLVLLQELPTLQLVEGASRSTAAIVHFEAHSYWEALRDNGTAGPFDNLFTAEIVASRDSADEHAETAVGLLRGFVEGRIPADLVFDTEETGRVLAIAEIWSADRALHWTRAHFYYDPIRARLAPVPGLDATSGARAADPLHLVAARGALGQRLLADESIRRHYVRNLHRLARETEAPSWNEERQEVESSLLQVIHRQAPRTEPLDLARIADRARALETIEPSREAWFAPTLALGNFVFPQVLAAYALEDSEGPYLEMLNLLPIPVSVTTLRHDGLDGNETPVTMAARTPFPIELPPTPAGARPEAVRVRYRPLNTTAVSTEIRGVARVAGEEREHRFRATPSVPALTGSPVPTATLDEALAQHPFLRWVPGDPSLHAGPGRIEVSGSLVLPAPMGLRIEPGTELVFQARAALLVSGPLDLRGSKEAPIVLRGARTTKGSRWQGVALLRASEPSKWRHVELRDADGIRLPGWELPSSITVRDAAIEVDTLRILRSGGSDALKLVGSPFELRNLSITDSSGTALSLLRSDGDIEDLRISGTGLHGVAVSGSTVNLRRGTIERVRATAIEALDGSNVEANDLEISGASVAMSVKNGARGSLGDSTLSGLVHVPLLAFSDRPDLGGGELIASGNEIEAPSGSELALAQRGSRAVVDGVAVTEVDADIGELRID